MLQEPEFVPITLEAKELWITYYHAIEGELGTGGSYAGTIAIITATTGTARATLGITT